jgi:hypothetical protein
LAQEVVEAVFAIGSPAASAGGTCQVGAPLSGQKSFQMARTQQFNGGFRVRVASQGQLVEGTASAAIREDKGHVKGQRADVNGGTARWNIAAAAAIEENAVVVAVGGIMRVGAAALAADQDHRWTPPLSTNYTATILYGKRHR